VLIAAYAVLAVCHLLIAIAGFRLWREHGGYVLLTLILPIIALVYDNTIAALGAFIGEGSLLHALTYPRFVGHAFLTPIWILSSVGLAAFAGSVFAQRVWVRRGSWVLYLMMVLMGVFDALLLLELAPLREGSVLVYTNVGGLPGPPAPAIVMVLTTMLCGALVWRQIRWPWMFAGATLMLVAAAIPAEVTGFILSATGEVVLAAALVATARRVLRD